MSKKIYGFFKVFFALIVTLGTANSANAGSASGYITGLNTEAGSAKFYVTNGHANGPGCAVSQRWAVDITTPAGQTMWSTILTAYSQHKNVQVGGIQKVLIIYLMLNRIPAVGANR